MSSGPSPFDALFAELEPVGRDAKTGGYNRFAWTAADSVLREWFAGHAQSRGLDLTTDRAGNQWAWWGDPDADGSGLVLGFRVGFRSFPVGRGKITKAGSAPGPSARATLGPPH